AEGDALSQDAGLIENIDRAPFDVAILVAGGDVGAHLPVVNAPTFDGRETEGGKTRETSGGPVLPREVVAAAAGRRESQVGVSKRPNAGLETGHGEGILPERAAEGELVGKGSRVVVGAGVRSGLDGIEIIQVDVAETLRGEVKSRGDEVLIGDGPIELGEG